MLRIIKDTFNNIRDAIIEQGVPVSQCDSPTTYANKILQINGGSGNSLLLVPVFKSSETKPSKPVGQISSLNPTDYPEGWGSPDENLTGNIWMSYTIVGTSTIYVDWTEPILISEDNESIVVPTLKSQPWIIYAKSDTYVDNLAAPNKEGVYWDVIANTLEGNIISHYDGGTITWNSEDEGSGYYKYISFGNFISTDGITGTLEGNWTPPVCINASRPGKDGINGVDGTNVEYIYKLWPNKDTWRECPSPTNIPSDSSPSDDPTQTGFIPEDWMDHPQSIDPVDYPIELMCMRKMDLITNQWSRWYGPYPWSIWGADGTDGDGVEYIFLVVGNSQGLEDNVKKNSDGVYELINHNLWPPTSESEFLSIIPNEQKEHAKELFQQDEFVPGNNADAQSIGWDKNWTDNPLDVASNQPFEFCSVRKQKNGIWGYFSEPKLWSKYPYADVSIFTSIVFAKTFDDIHSAVLSQDGGASSPIPTVTTVNGQPINITWYDSIPEGNGDIWMASKLFNDDPEQNQDWSSPMKLKDSANFQIEYSADYPGTGVLPKFDAEISGAHPFLDNTDSEGINEIAWREYCRTTVPFLGNWGDSIVDASYMATCWKKDGIWKDWVITKIKGEQGIGIVSQKEWYAYNEFSNGVVSPLNTATISPGIVNTIVNTCTIGGNSETITWYENTTQFDFETVPSTVKYLWVFTRTIYTNGDIEHGAAYVKYDTSGQQSIDIQQIEERVTQNIESDYGQILDGLRNDIDNTPVVIGNAINGVLNGTITSQDAQSIQDAADTFNLINGDIQHAKSVLNAAGYTNEVANAKWCWKRRAGYVDKSNQPDDLKNDLEPYILPLDDSYYDMGCSDCQSWILYYLDKTSSEWSEYYRNGTITDQTKIATYEDRANFFGYDKVLITSSISSIEQKADSISATVTDGDSLAQLVLTSNQFEVTADKIDINGLVTALNAEELSAKEINVTDSNDNVVGGFHSYDNVNNGARFWLGGSTFDSAPFKVDQSGIVTTQNVNTTYNDIDIKDYSAPQYKTLDTNNRNVRLYCSTSAGSSATLYVKLPTPNASNLGAVFNIWIDPYDLSNANNSATVQISCESTWHILTKWDYSFVGGNPQLSPSFKDLSYISAKGGYVQFTCIKHFGSSGTAYYWLVTNNELYDPTYTI